MNDEDKVKLWLIAVICVFALIAISSGIGWFKSAGNYRRANDQLKLATNSVQQAQAELNGAATVIFRFAEEQRADRADYERLETNYIRLAESYEREREIYTAFIKSDKESNGLIDYIGKLIERNKDIATELQKRNAD